MADAIVDVGQELNSPDKTQNLPYLQMRFGSVVALNTPDNTCSIQLSGDTSVTIPGVKAVSTFQPTVGDNVCCLKQGTDVVVIGKFQTATASAYAQITNIITANNVLTGPTGFANLSSSPNSVTVNKAFTPSKLFISLSITGWGDVTSTGFTAAVNINGTDYVCAAINLDLRLDNAGNIQTTTQRVPCVGSTVVTGLPTGSTTVTIRIKNHGVSGNLHVDTGDFYTLTVQEIL